MNLKLLSLALALTLLLTIGLSIASDNNDDGDWYPFVIPEKLDLDSPVNIGKLVLDPPAGKHGFCKVKDGHFYFEDGTRAKFWGTNLCMSACFPTKEQAVMIANRLAFFGFNAVRLHQFDMFFEPNGIFKDVSPAYKDLQMKKTGVLSEKQLDRLDYLIYQLKIRGIYIDMNLLVSRHFTEADGVKDAAKLGMAAKPVSMFDAKLIELQKKYAKDLLTHYNPYTKLRYCDDPVIALVEITNENSLEKIGTKNIPEYYSRQLEDKWRLWKKTNNGTEKEFYIDIEKFYFQEMTNFLRAKLNIKIPINGTQYSSLETQESCDFIDKHAYWDHPRFPNKRWDQNDFRIHNKSMLQDSNLGIIGEIIKASTSRQSQTDVRKPYTITEWNHCYPNQFAYETPLLLSSKAVENNWDGLFQFDFKAFLLEHPQNNAINNYFEIMANPQQLILNGLASVCMFKNKDLKVTIKDGILPINSDFIKGAAGFIKNKPIAFDNFTIISNQDGAVFIYSSEDKPLKESKQLILVTISGVKNTASGWNKEGKFHWGNVPTLLKKIAVVVAFDAKSNLKVYELDRYGRRLKEVLVENNGKNASFSTEKGSSLWFEITKE